MNITVHNNLALRPLCLIEESLAFLNICTIEVAHVRGIITKQKIEHQFAHFLQANPILSVCVKGDPASRYFEKSTTPSLIILDNCNLENREGDVFEFSSSLNSFAQTLTPENSPTQLDMDCVFSI